MRGGRQKGVMFRKKKRGDTFFLSGKLISRKGREINFLKKKGAKQNRRGMGINLSLSRCLLLERKDVDAT